jgi:hypothetical protein
VKTIGVQMREDAGLYRSDRQPDENGRHRMLVAVWLSQAERDRPVEYKARLQNALRSCRLLYHHFIQLGFRRLRPALPLLFVKEQAGKDRE